MPMEFTLNPAAAGPAVVRILQRIFAIPKVRAWIPYPKVAKWLLPWTIIYEPLGAITVSVDAASWWAWTTAVKYLSENSSTFDRNVPSWDQIGGQILDYIRTAPDLDIIQRWADRHEALQDEFLKALNDIRIGEAQIVVQVAPMWLADP